MNELTDQQWYALGRLYAFWQMWGDKLALMNIGGVNEKVFLELPELARLGLADDLTVTPEQFNKMKSEATGDIPQGMMELASALFDGKSIEQFRITELGRQVWQDGNRQTWWDKFKNDIR